MKKLKHELVHKKNIHLGKYKIRYAENASQRKCTVVNGPRMDSRRFDACRFVKLVVHRMHSRCSIETLYPPEIYQIESNRQKLNRSKRLNGRELND